MEAFRPDFRTKKKGKTAVMDSKKDSKFKDIPQKGGKKKGARSLHEQQRRRRPPKNVGTAAYADGLLAPADQKRKISSFFR